MIDPEHTAGVQKLGSSTFLIHSSSLSGKLRERQRWGGFRPDSEAPRMGHFACCRSRFPRLRHIRRDVSNDEIKSPFCPADYVVPQHAYDEVAPGHLVQRGPDGVNKASRRMLSRKDLAAPPGTTIRRPGQAHSPLWASSCSPVFIGMMPVSCWKHTESR